MPNIFRQGGWQNVPEEERKKEQSWKSVSLVVGLTIVLYSGLCLIVFPLLANLIDALSAGH